MLDDETIAALKANGTFIVSNPHTNAYMLERGAAGGYQDYQLRKSREVKDLKVESLRKAIKAGIPVAYGHGRGRARSTASTAGSSRCTSRPA